MARMNERSVDSSMLLRVLQSRHLGTGPISSSSARVACVNARALRHLRESRLMFVDLRASGLNALQSPRVCLHLGVEVVRCDLVLPRVRRHLVGRGVVCRQMSMLCLSMPFRASPFLCRPFCVASSRIRLCRRPLPCFGVSRRVPTVAEFSLVATDEHDCGLITLVVGNEGEKDAQHRRTDGVWRG